MRMKCLSALALAGAFSTAVAGQNPATLVIINARVIDVRTGRVTPPMTVTVQDGKIATVENVPRTGQNVDARGRFLIPGLIDAHTHIADLPAARRALESGVTTVRSAGVSHFVDVGLRDLVKTGLVEGPDVLAAGYHVRPQLAREVFISTPALAPLIWDRGASGSDAIRAVVKANLSHGVDWIKTTSTERAGLPDTDPRKQLYTEADVKVMVDEAAAKGIPVMAHAHGEEGALAAVKAGVRSIEHGTYLSEDALRLMKEKGTYLVPTYATVIDLVEPGGDYNDPRLHLRGRHMLMRLRETTQRAITLGVKVITGADTSYGPNSVTRIAHEVAAFVEMGMTPLQALQSATITAAELLRIESRTGAIETGMEADLVLVERNPLEEVATLQDPLVVISNGRIAVDRSNFKKAPQAATPSQP
jgi:imidazolonepropionase-like amidohydrolase